MEVARGTDKTNREIQMALAEFSLGNADDARVIVEVEALRTGGGVERVAVGADGLIEAGQTFEASLNHIKTVAAKALSVLRELSPDEGELSMGFKLTAQSGVILVKAGGEANIGVKLVWRKKV